MARPGSVGNNVSRMLVSFSWTMVEADVRWARAKTHWPHIFLNLVTPDSSNISLVFITPALPLLPTRQWTYIDPQPGLWGSRQAGRSSRYLFSSMQDSYHFSYMLQNPPTDRRNPSCPLIESGHCCLICLNECITGFFPLYSLGIFGRTNLPFWTFFVCLNSHLFPPPHISFYDILFHFWCFKGP